MSRFSSLNKSKMLTLSAKHLNDETFRMLRKLGADKIDTEYRDIVVYAKDENASAVHIHLYPGESIENGKDPYDDIPYRDLYNLLMFATDLDCDVLCIDMLEEPLVYLPIY